MMQSVVCLTSVAYIVNIHGAHSYWKQGALGAADVRMGRSVQRAGAYCVATRTACLFRPQLNSPVGAWDVAWSS